MHPDYRKLLEKIERALDEFNGTIRQLPGIQMPKNRRSLALQMVESQRKIDRTTRLAKRTPSANHLIPGAEEFDPERAAAYHGRAGRIDEACWLVFLSVHFGMHAHDGWLLCRQIYGALGPDPFWTWERTSQDLPGFRIWLEATLKARNEPLGRFGNHRKYESLRSSSVGLPSVIESYVVWVGRDRSHAALMQTALHNAGGDPKMTFAALFESMENVLRFGRLGRFDYLTMISKLGIAPIEADSTYLASATGPKRGAKLLFYGSKNSLASNLDLEQKIAKLAAHLGLGMQAMEDSLCNWQKSPTEFIAFRG